LMQRRLYGKTANKEITLGREKASLVPRYTFSRR
jgi:hypothetical protein